MSSATAEARYRRSVVCALNICSDGNQPTETAIMCFRGPTAVLAMEEHVRGYAFLA